MLPKLKYFSINWENGMKLNKQHFIQQENAFYDKIKDSSAGFINPNNYGLLASGIENETSFRSFLKVDNQNFLKVKIFQCRAITEGGARIEILENQQLPEFEINLNELLENSKKEDNTLYYLLLTTDIFNRQPFGEIDTEEEPPRFPYSRPAYKIDIVNEKQAAATNGSQPYSLTVGKLEVSGGKPIVHDDYIPPCTTINSHIQLVNFFNLTEKFYGQLELDLLSIIKKIKGKGQDTNLAQSVLALAQNLLNFISGNLSGLHWHVANQPPIFLFEYIATSARVIRNTIDSNAAENKEEMLNYFTNWSELKQGDFEKLLVFCINFEYKHIEILESIEQFTEFITIMEMLFTKLESLAYIGKKKETNIFVKEHKSRRSFLAD